MKLSQNISHIIPYIPQTFIKHLLWVSRVLGIYQWTKQIKTKTKQNKNPALNELTFYEDMRRGWIGKEERVIKQFERGAHLVFQTSFEVANKIHRLIALKFSILHGLATQIVIHLNGKDGSCCAFILSTLLSWKGQWQHLIYQARNRIKAELLIRKHSEIFFELYANTINLCINCSSSTEQSTEMV